MLIMIPWTLRLRQLRGSTQALAPEFFPPHTSSSHQTIARHDFKLNVVIKRPKMRQFASPWRLPAARFILARPIKNSIPLLLRIPRCTAPHVTFTTRLQSSHAASNAARAAEEAAKRQAKDAGGKPGRKYGTFIPIPRDRKKKASC